MSKNLVSDPEKAYDFYIWFMVVFVCPHILKSSFLVMKYARTFLVPVQKRHYFTSAAGVSEAAGREKTLSISVSVWNMTRSLGFM